jgi:hypothetical protein
MLTALPECFQELYKWGGLLGRVCNIMRTVLICARHHVVFGSGDKRPETATRSVDTKNGGKIYTNCKARNDHLGVGDRMILKEILKK